MNSFCHVFKQMTVLSGGYFMKKLTVLATVMIVLLSSNVLYADPASQTGHGVITVDNADELVRIGMLGRSSINAVVWSPINDVVAVASEVGVWLYDATNLDKEPQLLEGHYSSIESLAFSTYP
jgi:WD40 repeat protein